ncbi:MAG: siroheme synthase CysG, partial [Sulfitobacter sp.]
MDHFPIFLSTNSAHIVVSGGGDAAMAKLRLLMKSTARITVFAAQATPEIETWQREGKLTLVARALAAGDADGAKLFYGANEDAAEDARTAQIAKTAGALVNIVDNLHDSEFITPAIVDRDPVTIAIGTEGAAPVLARAIKADLEERLPQSLGALARIGKTFRDASYALTFGRARRDFWRDFYFNAGPKAIAEGEAHVKPALDGLLKDHLNKKARAGHVAFVGGGPGDPELLTLKARRALDEADVVIYDRLITPEILELARREATMIDVGKEGFGPSTPQEHINDLLVEHAQTGAQVVRLKSGDATVFGRLDEEIDAVDAHNIGWHIVPGITSASAAVASIGQ